MDGAQVCCLPFRAAEWIAWVVFPSLFRNASIPVNIFVPSNHKLVWLGFFFFFFLRNQSKGLKALWKDSGFKHHLKRVLKTSFCRFVALFLPQDTPRKTEKGGKQKTSFVCFAGYHHPVWDHKGGCMSHKKMSLILSQPWHVENILCSSLFPYSSKFSFYLLCYINLQLALAVGRS